MEHGYNFRDYQRGVLELSLNAVYEGRNVFVCLPTGIPANYPSFCLNIPLFYVTQAQFASFKQVLAFMCQLLVNNFVKFKQKYGKSSKIVSSIINFVRLAGMHWLWEEPLLVCYGTRTWWR